MVEIHRREAIWCQDILRIGLQVLEEALTAKILCLLDLEVISLKMSNEVAKGHSCVQDDLKDYEGRKVLEDKGSEAFRSEEVLAPHISDV